MLQDYQLDKNVKKTLAVAFCVNTGDKTINKVINNAVDKGANETVKGNEKNKRIINVKEFSNKFSKTNNFFSTSLQQIIPKSSRDGKGEIDETGKLLKKLFKKVYKDNKVVKEIMDAKARGL